MDWKNRALALLKDSLEPVPSELNEIDWKTAQDKILQLSISGVHMPDATNTMNYILILSKRKASSYALS